ncbi:hypothetical protein [Ferrimonas lipolytica]|uniref:Nucleoside recognition n=1 Tax=Ferrimonas lipolytica TaxID=2724191 RepID=A0A6H1UG18_9GAMM|nr:hypothetical protein [Ferrimonas lipolytica]QIZ78047.1 hypothetical protein HER31_14775 [Ferrimonas lipolytica]
MNISIYKKFSAPKTVQITVLFLLSAYAMLVNAEFGHDWVANNLHMTCDFLGKVAPGILLLVLLLALLHHAITCYLPNVCFNGGSRYQSSLFFGTLSSLFGNTKVLLILFPVLAKLSTRQRFTMLTIGFCSSGGITCLSLASLGYSAWQLFAATIALPMFAALVLPWILGRDPNPEPLTLHISPMSLYQRVSSYFEGAYKMVANRLLIIAFIETFLISANGELPFGDGITAVAQWWLDILGFPAEASAQLAEFWLAKTFISRDVTMVALHDYQIFSLLSTSTQLAAIVLLVNIVCLCALVVISLNLLAMFGRASWPILKLMPAAFLLAFSLVHLLTMLLLLVV